MEKLFYFNICSGIYIGWIPAQNKNDAQIKLIQAFSKVQAINLGDVEITELEDLDSRWNREREKKEYSDCKMLYEEYGIICK